METLFVRLKPYDPQRGHVLRRYTYRGIKFQEDRGWYRVPKEVGAYLRTVHQRHGDAHSSHAFDVCTEAEAKKLEAEESAAEITRRKVGDEIRISMPKDEALPSAPSQVAATETNEDPANKRPKKG